MYSDVDHILEIWEWSIIEDEGGWQSDSISLVDEEEDANYILEALM